MSIELTTIIVLAIAVLVGLGFGLQRNSYGRRLKRNNRYQQLLASASQLIHDTPDEDEFLREICRLICRMDPVRLAWIGRPRPDGQITAIASCGEVGYLDQVHVSVREDLEAGQGPIGKAWRSGEAIFDTKTLSDPRFEPWRAVAKQHQLMGIHALPIHCDGEVDAILAVYFGPKGGPELEERLLFERLANDLATGISKIREHRHNHRLATALAQISEAVFILDLDGQITWYNDGFLRLFAFAPDEILGSDPAKLLGDPKFEELLELVDSEGTHELLTDWEALQTSQTGEGLWVHVSVNPLLDDRGTTSGIVVVEVDLTDEKAAIDAELRLLAILDYTSDGVGITDRHGQLIYLNSGARQLIGLGHDTPAEGRQFLDLIADADGREQFSTSVQEAAIAGRWEGEINIRRRDGVTIPLSIVLMAHRDSGGHVQYLSAIARNILDQKEREDELSYLAEHDALTGLPNRRVLGNLLDAAIANARATGCHFAIGVIDLDDFKPVNDRFGHHAGDALLVALSSRLTSNIRDGDAIIRLAGDEFVVILNGLSRSRTELLESLDAVLSKLHRAVETPFELDKSNRVAVDMSIGVALFPDNSTEPDALLREADAALYVAKQGKHERLRWWTLRSDTVAIPETRAPTTNSPYGPSAAALLTTLLSDVDALNSQVLDDFYLAVGASNANLEAPSRPSAEEYGSKLGQLIAHLSTLLTPELARVDLERCAHDIGVALALTGLSTEILVNAASIYRMALTGVLSQMSGQPRDLQRVVTILERRIEDDLSAELHAMTAVTEAYFGIFANPLPAADQLWIDIIQAELDAIGSLPGIGAVCLARQGNAGNLVIEGYAGQSGRVLADSMNAPEFQVAIDPRHPTGQMLSARAWREAHILIADNITDGSVLGTWKATSDTLALRSAAAIPIQNLDGRPIGLLLLVGHYQGQFSSDWIGRFNQSLQQRWENLFYRIATPDNVLAREQAIGYRELLLTGGLQMYVQPIIDLKSGQLAMVEGLARLVRSDGTVIGPDAFLGILGASERKQLFCIGLETLLAAEQGWRLRGLDVGLAINTDASTLNDPQLPSWLAATLAKWDFSVDRLTLELLETDQHHRAPDLLRLRELQSLGLHLAIDDMGSGYSNWLRLVEIPATLVKVDHKFVARMNTHPRRVINLLGTLILTASDSGQRVVVEGIESPVLAEVATRLGADFGQGFGIARPMAADRLADWALSYQHQHHLDQELHSLLGAMAYHWAFVHGPVQHRRGRLEDCALTRYFDRNGMNGSVGATLHRELHSWDTPPASVVKGLTDWFEAALASMDDPLQVAKTISDPASAASVGGDSTSVDSNLHT
ncbi:diguanylate cyclase domain-containing protein [Ferrimicrobium acidiphilum]|uniref:diguanylate cyclase domain-containing protein n=1 Tax=Ferrimicrobium acidiphilum TaxID=121039 RepID=UPI0023F27F43|nr:diguanylate cyclase [Ferrimicrobium acidiphilum]